MLHAKGHRLRFILNQYNDYQRLQEETKRQGTCTFDENSNGSSVINSSRREVHCLPFLTIQPSPTYQSSHVGSLTLHWKLSLNSLEFAIVPKILAHLGA